MRSKRRIGLAALALTLAVPLAAVGGACRDRQEAQAREAFDRAQELLRRAAGTLAPYGQKP